MKRFSQICGVLVLSFASLAAQALDKVDGVYHIATADDFVAFAALANDDEPAANALLTADIDLSELNEITIGAAFSYEGVFDGGYHTITIHRESNRDGSALFGYLAGTVRNLTVTGYINTWGKYASGLVVRTSGDQGKIINCVSTVTIESDTSGDGTHGGIVALVEGKAQIENTVFAGAFIGGTTCWGGFVGWSTGNTELKNCLMIGDTSEASTESSNTFSRNPGNCTFSNCYYRDAFGNVPGGITQINDEMLSSGQVCFMLNGLQSDNCVWFQTIGTDALPTTNPASAIVYANGRMHCNGDAYDGEMDYANEKKSMVMDEHNLHNGICDYCQQPDPNYMTATDGVYEIGNPAQLVWFAAMVNSGTANDIAGRLTAPIDLAEVEWPSIGIGSFPYAGNFDGQFFPIYNLNKPLFGTAKGANITRIAIESGEINGRDTRLGSQTGSIVCVGSNCEVTQSYSRASIVLGNEGDLGGIAGKLTGTIRGCAFLGSITSAGWSEGGIAGSGEVSQITIEDCIVIADLITTGGDAKGTILGWNDDATIRNCFTIEKPEGFRGFSGNTDDAGIANEMLPRTEFGSGRVAWLLNHSTFVNPIWFQTLDEDEYPVLDPTHDMVYEVAEDEYVNSMDQVKSRAAEMARDYAEDVMAQKSLIEAYLALVPAVENAATPLELSDAYAALTESREAVEKSAEAYAAFVDFAKGIQTYVDENGGSMSGITLDRLEIYLGNDCEPGEEGFENGSLAYILTNCALTAEQLLAEAAFAQSLLDDAVRGGYAAGSDITALIRNANLDAEPNFEGWNARYVGSKLTVLREEGVTYSAETWNATFDLNQTITGLQNGVYELRLNAVYRAANNDYDGNNNYGGYLYAGNNAVYVMTAGEDLIAEADAVNMENCYTEGTGNIDALFDNGIVAGYCPTGPIGCFYAFGAGRYENRIVARVTDGTLTIGVKNAGTGCDNDWLGFDNFRLIYLGNDDEAAEGILPTIDGMVARALTTLAYTADSGENYRAFPNFSNDLRTRLQQAIDQAAEAKTTDERMAVVETFTAIFRDIYSCKQAYVVMESLIESLVNDAFENPNISDEERTELQMAVAVAMEKWANGDYTEEQARNFEDLNQTQFCRRYLENAPAQINGVWQLASLDDLQWFMRLVNEMGLSNASAALTAPIDLTGIEWQPIGTVAKPYTGEFNGGLQPITELTAPFFGTVNNAKISGIAIVGGKIAGNGDFAEHTGSIIGLANGTTALSRSYSTAHLRAAVGDVGGLIGKVKGSGTIKDCYFAGNLTVGWSAGCLVGSSDGTTIADVSDCFVDASGVNYRNGDAHGLVVGWLHGGLVPNFHNVYLIAGADLTNVMGNTDDAAGAAEACKTLTSEQFASGEVAYLLNHGNETDPIWRQTLGKDNTPVLATDHLVVIVNPDGTYANATPEDGIESIHLSNRFAGKVNVYTLNGQLVRAKVNAKDALNGLPTGIYVVGGTKVLQK